MRGTRNGILYECDNCGYTSYDGEEFNRCDVHGEDACPACWPQVHGDCLSLCSEEDCEEGT